MYIIRRIIFTILWFMAAASASYDIILSLREQAPVTTPLGRVWYSLHPDSLNLMQAVVQRYIWPDLWDNGAVWLLQWPLWGVVLGIVFVSWIVRLAFSATTRRPS
ncbi:MAG: hypothetical protein V6Z81_00510 [Parvularculales bacterium]